ncbi:hypothetical protein D3C81_2057740 [compost metagenome]
MTLWTCGISNASITTRKIILALNSRRLNRSTNEVPTHTTPPATKVNSNTPIVGDMLVPVQSLMLEAKSSPAPLMYAAVSAYIKNIMLKPVIHCP